MFELWSWHKGHTMPMFKGQSMPARLCAFCKRHEDKFISLLTGLLDITKIPLPFYRPIHTEHFEPAQRRSTARLGTDHCGLMTFLQQMMNNRRQNTSTLKH